MTLSTLTGARPAIAPSNASSARIRLCTQIHKELRAFMATTLTGLGHIDCHDDQALKCALDQLDQLLDFCGGHAQYVAAIARLRVSAERLACASGLAREPAAAHLYRQLALFVANYFQHMEAEESQDNARLWASYSDAELARVHAAMVASFGPQPVASRRAESSVVEQFIDAVFVRFDADAAARLITPDFVSHPWAALGAPAGPAGVHAIVPFFRTAFGEVSATVLDRLVDGDRVALRYVYAGRHVGDLFGLPATGRRFSIEGLAILRLDDGRVAEYWREEDMLGLQRQLGVASLLPAASA